MDPNNFMPLVTALRTRAMYFEGESERNYERSTQRFVDQEGFRIKSDMEEDLSKTLNSAADQLMEYIEVYLDNTKEM